MEGVVPTDFVEPKVCKLLPLSAEIHTPGRDIDFPSKGGCQW